jgi:hypothetical protein
LRRAQGLFWLHQLRPAYGATFNQNGGFGQPDD